MDKRDDLYAKLRAGQAITYDDVADLFETTRVGQATMAHNRLSRADMLAMVRAKYPDERALTEVVRKFLASFDQAMGQAMH